MGLDSFSTIRGILLFIFKHTWIIISDWLNHPWQQQCDIIPYHSGLFKLCIFCHVKFSWRKHYYLTTPMCGSLTIVVLRVPHTFDLVVCGTQAQFFKFHNIIPRSIEIKNKYTCTHFCITGLKGMQMCGISHQHTQPNKIFHRQTCTNLFFVCF